MFLLPENCKVITEFSKNKEIKESDLTQDSSKNLNFILDLEHFYCNPNNEDPSKFNTNYLKNIVKNLKNFGFSLVLIDHDHLLKVSQTINELIKEQPNTHYLLKLYIIDKVPLVSLLYIQVLHLKTPVVLDKLKFLLFEVYSNLAMSQSEEVPFSKLESTVAYMLTLYSYQFFLKHVKILIHYKYVLKI